MSIPALQTCDNGCQLIAVAHADPARAALVIEVQSGSLDVPGHWPGLAHFFEHLVFLGGERFLDDQRLMPFVQACGGQVNATTGPCATQYFVEVPASELEAAAWRMVDMLARPRLAIEAQRREREVLEAEYRARAGDAVQLGQSALLAMLLPDHPLSAFHAGNAATLAVEQPAFQQALHDYHRLHYRAGNLRIALVAPQATETTLALGRQLAAAFAPGLPPVAEASRPLGPAPCRHWRLGMPPTSVPRLWLGLVVDDTRPPAVEALARLLESRLPGSLFETLLQAGWASDLQLHRLYRQAEQAVMGLEITLVEGTLQEASRVRRAVLDWLAFLQAQGAAAPVSLEVPPDRLAPLVVARDSLERQALGTQDAGALAESLVRLSQRLQASGLPSVLAAGPVDAGEARLVCGFPARVQRVVLPDAEARLTISSLPHNPLLAPRPTGSAVAHPGWPAALSRRSWHCPDTALGLRFSWSRPHEGTARWSSAALASVRAASEQAGLGLDLGAWSGGFDLLCQGPLERLAAQVSLIAEALTRLPLPESAPAGDPMPLRRLFGLLRDYLPAAPSAVEAGDVSLAQGYWHGALFGQSSASLAAALQAMPGLPAPADTVRPLAPGRHRHLIASEAGDGALVLFCPVAGRDAQTEAAWRLMGQYFQPRFYRRMREELGLGYGVYCGFQVLADTAGLVFGVQSPHAPVEAILEHVEDFLVAQRDALAALDPVELKSTAALMGERLAADRAGRHGLARALWHAYLAELPEAHALRVGEALRCLSPTPLLEACQALIEARGGWLVLSCPGPNHA